MAGLYRQQRRRTKPWFTVFLALVVLCWPMGEPMPAVPGTKAATTQVTELDDAVGHAAPFGELLEDDVEVEHHELTVHEAPVRGSPDTDDSLISAVWMERPHRPPRCAC
jgi:hypothetical protein